jgi:argininosuccinate lyase
MKMRPAHHDFVTPQEFVASIGFDHRLAPYDLTASIAHAEMLGRRRIISPRDSGRIAGGLRRLLAQLKKGRRPLMRAEDVHYAIEKTLFRTIGPLAGKLHTARSRNDQTVTALRLYLRDRIDETDARLRGLIGAFVSQAEKNIAAVMPGYTHLQPGQPLLLSHHLLAYAWMFQRDRERLADARKRVNRLPLGAAALAGTTFPIDRAWVAKRLGFAGVVENSVDAVSDRDFLVEFLAAASLIMVHLSRLGEELVQWCAPALGFVTIADPFVTGSSIMPQKRNPDVAEIVRGKSGRVFGSLTALLTILKAQPLAYNRDLQEDKPPVFDAVDQVTASLDVAAPMVRSLVFHREKMRDACRLGHLLATDVADGLVRRGIPFRQAHGFVAEAVRHAHARGLSLEQVPLSVWRSISPVFGPWLTETLSLDKAVRARVSPGGTAPVRVKEQIRSLRRLLRS